MEKEILQEYRRLLIISDKFYQAADDIGDMLHKIADEFTQDIPNWVYELDLTDMTDEDIDDMLKEAAENG
jgi:hypothetical protein